MMIQDLKDYARDAIILTSYKDKNAWADTTLFLLAVIITHEVSQSSSLSFFFP